uniref:PRLI-interacting factor A n=1 Tax=Chenopodium quinoa TaxID=63459 RepID=A0A803KLY7_CHEQI
MKNNQSEMLMVSHSQMMNQSQMVNQQMPAPPQNQAQMVSQAQMAANQPKMMVSQAQMAANQPSMMASQAQMAANQPSMMVGQNYGQWSMPPPQMNAMKFANPMNQMKDGRRKDNNKALPGGGIGGVGGLPSIGPGGGLSYQPPTLYELEQQNRLKARRFYHPKKKFNRMGPYAHAPRNTTSYIIRAKKSGGIASLVSPCPVTPAVLPTPVFSPSREALVDMAKEEWGVDGYGESDVEEHVEVERRLDHDLSRFEMIYPNSGADYHNVLENRVDDQDTHIAQLEEENLILKERLYLMERELGELRRRLLCLERQNQVVEDINEEVVENVSENDSEGLRNLPFVVNKHNEEVDSLPGNRVIDSEARREDSGETLHKELKELAVKEVYDDEVMRSHGTSVGLEEYMQDNGLTNDGLGYRLMVDNRDKEHSEELPKDFGKGPIEHLEPENNKDISSSVGNEEDNINVAVKKPIGDAYMGETLAERDVKDRTEVNLKQDEAVVGGTEAVESDFVMVNESAGDVCMGDALVIDREVKNVESTD